MSTLEEIAAKETSEKGIMGMIKENQLTIGVLVVVVILLVAGYWFFMTGDATTAASTTEHFDSKEVTKQQMLVGALVVGALYMAMNSGSAERLHLF